MKTIKEPIRLRKKKLKDGNESIYLDIYHDGKRSYKFLKLYLIPEKTKADRDANRNTMILAQSIKAKRIIELKNGEYGFNNDLKTNVRFFDYFKTLMNEKQNEDTDRNFNVWKCTLNHLEGYEDNKNITFKDITEEWVSGFITYLNKCHNLKDANAKKLSENSKWIYFSKLKVCLNCAVKQGIINKNPSINIEGYAKKEVERSFLSIEEIKKLSQAECIYPEVKRAFLFSCLTGLRWSDVTAIHWKDITTQSGFSRITFKQKKTKGLMYLDITKQAAELMGERKNDNDVVFPTHMTSVNFGRVLKKWVKSAGINKNISFHCARHSFAIMMLNLGVDIYTLSKLLGHSNLSTTQIYAKVLDKKKQEAVNIIPQII